MTDKTDLERLGLFKEMGYHTIGDPYKPSLITSRDGILKGKGFLGDTTRLKAANDDGYFNKPFVRLFQGECESNLVVLRRRWRIKMSEQNLGKVFIMSSPAKKQSGVGSRLGCIHEVIPYFSGVPRSKSKAPNEKKNFITNPGKKGTGYGYVDVCLNPYPEATSEYYDNSRNVYFRKDMADHKLKSLNRNEFIPSGAYGGYFDPNPFYSDIGPGKIKLKSEIQGFVQNKVFIPNSYSKLDGGMKAGTINPYPASVLAEYKDAGLQYLVRDVRNNTEKLYNRIPGSKSSIFQSILQKNVNFRVNNLNSHSIKSVMS